MTSELSRFGGLVIKRIHRRVVWRDKPQLPWLWAAVFCLGVWLPGMAFGADSAPATGSQVAPSLAAKALAPDRPDQPENLADIVGQITDASGFNGAVLIAQKGVLIYQRYIGFADSDAKIPLQAHHQFSPGSVGKEVTTMVLMQLIAQGLIQADDPLSQYLPQLPAWSEAVTLEHILTHTSGLPKIQWHRNIDTPAVIQQIERSELAFTPGEGYLYSNLNVVLRALVAEAVTDKTFSTLVKTKIFDVAGMDNAFQKLAAKTQLAAKKAVDSSTDSSRLVVGDYPTAIKGVTIYMSPMDLMKFELAMAGGELLPWNTVAAALPGGGLSGQANRARYDFGHYQHDAQGRLQSWEHDGSNPSHHTLKYHNFTADYALVLMSSDGNKSTLYRIRDALVSHFEPK